MDISGIFYFISNVITLIAIILYLKKYRTPEGIMMLVGIIIVMLASVFFSWIFPALMRNGGLDAYQKYGGIIEPLTILGSLAFAVGLLVAFRKIAADKKQ